MGHEHAHAHGEGEGNFFLDQLFTILSCGAVGLVAVLMYQTGMLGRILAPMFFMPVLAGGIAVLLLVAMRAVAVWRLAGARAITGADATAAPHEHDHGHAHSNGHEDCGHDHGGSSGGHDHSHDHAHSHAHAHVEEEHGHDHGWAPWRYMVLAIPVFLYFLGLPRDGFSGDARDRSLSGGQLQQNPKRQMLSLVAGAPVMTNALRKTEPRRMLLRFKELAEAAAIPSRQEVYEGDIGVIRGQFVPLKGSDRSFTLFRVNMTCCAADAVFLEIRIVAPDPIQGIGPNQWVQVEGLISFQKNEKGKWIPVITLKSNDDIDPNAEPVADTSAF
jgi:phosphate/sulfate permease